MLYAKSWKKLGARYNKFFIRNVTDGFSYLNFWIKEVLENGDRRGQLESIEWSGCGSPVPEHGSKNACAIQNVLQRQRCLFAFKGGILFGSGFLSFELIEDSARCLCRAASFKGDCLVGAQPLERRPIWKSGHFHSRLQYP